MWYFVYDIFVICFLVNVNVNVNDRSGIALVLLMVMIGAVMMNYVD